MGWVVLAALAGAVLVVADRVLLWAERRGWVYYRRRSPESGSVSAAAFGPVFDVLQPTREIVAEEREHQRVVRHDDEQGSDR